MKARLVWLALSALCLCGMGCGDDAGGDADGGQAGSAGGAGTGGTGGTGGGGAEPGPLKYTGAFTMGDTIGAKHKCPMSIVGSGMGDNLSPMLAWSGGPAETKSYAVVLFDTRYGFFHWAIWDIPAGTDSLPEGIAAGFQVGELSGARQGGGPAQDKHAYFGPCSDAGPAAGTYEYRLYALSEASLELTEASTSSEIQAAIDAVELEQVIWEGTPE